MGQDDGMVVTVSLDLMRGGGGFGLALCEQGGAFKESELGGSDGWGFKQQRKRNHV